MLVLDEDPHDVVNPEGIAQLENLMRRDRNHSSVFMWTLGNEEREATTETGLHILSTMKQFGCEAGWIAAGYSGAATAGYGAGTGRSDREQRDWL